MTYYFLGASLPALSLGGTPPMTYSHFRALCGEHLSQDELAQLDSADDAGAPAAANGSFTALWRERENGLRNAIARFRAVRLKRDAAPYLRENAAFDGATEKAVADAYTKSTPAEREMTFDRFRWSVLEETAGFDPFSSNAILAYGLKLKIVERWAGMNADAGRQKLAGMIEQTETTHP